MDLTDKLMLLILALSCLFATTRVSLAKIEAKPPAKRKPQ